MNEPSFLAVEDILFIHQQEIKKAGGDPGIREQLDIQACADAPKASFDGEYMNNLFEMAASYIVCLTMWASYSLLSGIGVIYPLKMLPIVAFEILYKVVWLLLIAYPLWSASQLAGSPAEGMTSAFLWVVLPIIAMPWKFAFYTYVLNRPLPSGKSRV